MDKVLNAIKCHQCQRVLTNPIFLPCGHSICKVHSEEAGDQVTCPKCGQSHQNNGFVINNDFLEVINSQIGSIDFGPCHKEAREACDKLEDVLDLIDLLIKDPINFTNSAIDELKNLVLVKSEKLKSEIDERTEKLLALLRDYQTNCELNFSKSDFESSMKSLEKNRNETEKMLKESLEFLNQLRVDDEKWRGIKKECDRKFDLLNKEFELVKNRILMGEFDEKTAQVEFFVDVDLNELFRYEYLGINSEILDPKQKEVMLEICKISPQTKWKLLYRGSRDGYGAGDFHSKCDNISKTFTIIKTTKGHIFGGYTEQTWNIFSAEYVRDPNAYIYSLVNEFKYPFVMKVQNPEYAICRNKSYGPVFGYIGDICVGDNCNAAITSHSNIHSYSPPPDLKNTPNILAGSEKFQVQEIEVFCLQ